MAKDSNAQRTARKAAQRIINERQETRKIYRLLFTNRNRTKNVLLKNSLTLKLIRLSAVLKLKPSLKDFKRLFKKKFNLQISRVLNTLMDFFYTLYLFLLIYI